MHALRTLAFEFKSQKHKLSQTDYDIFVAYIKDAAIIYNFGNYLVRQLYFKNAKQEHKYDFDIAKAEHPSLASLITAYEDDNKAFSKYLSQILCQYAKLRGVSFSMKVVQGICRILQRDWKSYYALLKLKQSGGYDNDVTIPRYKRDGVAMLELNSQVISTKHLKQGYLGTASMERGIKLQLFVTHVNVQSARVLPRKNGIGFRVEVIYSKEVSEPNVSITSKTRTAAIDTGVDHLCMFTFNWNKRPISLSGLVLKSYNRLYNKKRGAMQSRLASGKHTSKRMKNLTAKRNAFINNKLGYYANMLVGYLQRQGVAHVVIGKNCGWKDGFHKKAHVNQNFVGLPIAKLIDKLTYKLSEAGISVTIQEESYTSKASFLSQDPIPTYGEEGGTKPKFSGYRQSRGVYKEKGRSVTIHADVNASYNIMCKAGVAIPTDKIYFLQKEHIYPVALNVA